MWFGAQIILSLKPHHQARRRLARVVAGFAYRIHDVQTKRFYKSVYPLHNPLPCGSVPIKTRGVRIVSTQAIEVNTFIYHRNYLLGA